MSSAISFVTLAALSAVNLVLTLGVVRRVNLLTRSAAATVAAVGAQPDTPTLPAVGAEPADFTALAFDGDHISRGDLIGQTLAGFFATGCTPCQQLILPFMSYAGALPGGRQQTLAVIAGIDNESAKLAGLLDTLARVIVEPAGGPAAAAFGVGVFPPVGMLDCNRPRASGVDMSRLPPVQSLAAASS